MRKLASPARLIVAGLLLLGLVVAILWVTPSQSYLFLPDRAHPVDPLIKVQGGRRPRGPGGIYFVDVFVRRASLFERLFPGIREGATLVPASQLLAPGESNTQRRTQDLREMSRSQQIAAAVALHAAGYKVVARPTGALVDDVDPKAPAARLLHPSDVIVAVDGRPVRTLAELHDAIAPHRPGDRLRILVHRGASTRVLDVPTISLGKHPRRTIIGIDVEQAADIRLPRSVRINAGDVGGPSAGLAFALDVYEELGHEVARGYRVAATGAIALDGAVLPIGGVEQKTIGVKRSHGDVFIVPAGDNARDAQRYAGSLRIIAVQSFQQALRALATLPPRT